MDKTKRVVLYGSDLVVSAVGATLRERVGFEIVQIDPLLPSALQTLEAVRPDIILFDLAGAQPDFSIAVLRKIPGLLLIGVDLKTDKVLVMSGKESRMLTMGNLVHIIETGRSRG
jgi:hypothetical protein